MKHRLAIIGYGGMGSWHHRNLAERVPSIEVVGAYDVRQEALDKAVEAGIHAYTSQEALLADPN
ncbi:MAG: Gfo/Idh/MocA family oxidoreductase, partial [Clostridiales bacterium]|nr:Gfo/Idh/MocA family oxidoreductase [Clostridiales bacterium]